MIGNILKAVNADEAKIFLSDSKGNWRLEYFPNYKANRPKEKPQHLAYLQNIIVDEFGAEVAWGQEADDALGIAQTDNTIICSIDKDLLMIPGNHFNFVKEEIKFITPEEGLYRFYKQLLTGDPGDNISVSQGLSCKGIGDKKATAILEGYNTEQDYFKAVRGAYQKAWLHKETEFCGFDRNSSATEDRYCCTCGEDVLDERDIDEILLKTGILLKIRTKENEIWQFPNMLPSQEEPVESSSGTQEQVSSPS